MRAVDKAGSLQQQVRAGLAAGAAGALLIALFLLGEPIAFHKPAGDAFAGMFGGIAATVMGPAANGNPGAPAIGVALHFAVAIFWALGYVYLARTQPQLVRRPWLSGIAFGLVVYVFMQIILITAGAYHRPGPVALLTNLVAHTLFFGLPVALIVARALNRTISQA